MRHQQWLGSAESLTLYAKLESKWGATGPQEMKAFFDMEPSGPVGAQLIDYHGDKAVLNVQGSLVNGDAWWHAFAVGEVTSYTAIKGAVSLLAKDDDIKEVILNVSSGGGSFSGLSSAAKSLKTLAKVKKLTGYTEDVSASAGYWLLSSASKVYASETAEVGSIGVIAMYKDVSRALEEDGIKIHTVKAGKYKDFGSSVTPYTDEELEYLQSRVDQAYKFFVKQVATSRKLSDKTTEQWAEAQMFFAEEAKQVGLVDEVADFTDLVSVSTSTKKMEHNMDYAEKLALIASGASPEEVLTAEELETFHAEQQEPEVTEQEPEVEAAAPATTQDFDLAKQLGRAEVKLEDAEAKLEILQGKCDLMSAQTASLLNVAQAAVGNLQVALQKPKEVKATADEVISQYETLKSELSARFPSGRKSAVKETEEMDFSAKIPDPYQSY